jgi:hypothetical protein
MIDFIQAYFLTIIIEYAILFLLLRKKQTEKLITRNAIIASSITLPFVWFVFPILGFGWEIQTAFAELFAFSIEAVAYRFLFNGISYKDAIIASLLCNSTSFILGLILL